MADFGPLGGVKIVGFISPTDTNDSYPVIDTLYGVDGLRNYSGGTSNLDLIPVLRRRAGMIVGIDEGDRYFKLDAQPWLMNISDWTEIFFQTSSGGTPTTLSALTDTTITTPTDGDVLIYSGGTWVNLEEKDIYFTASGNGQTIFSVLTSEPLDSENSDFYVNGVKQRYGLTYDYIISGGTDVVWVSTKHIINTDDELGITYL